MLDFVAMGVNKIVKVRSYSKIPPVHKVVKVQELKEDYEELLRGREKEYCSFNRFLHEIKKRKDDEPESFPSGVYQKYNKSGVFEEVNGLSSKFDTYG
ncbi:hypothetical protein lbkm_2043 [Lachnospiraceae bacterium KM106-2]|nr:hypothetical protein lbkm_2043 [Lachnospiraceae bacterium KM106-2]